MSTTEQPKHGLTDKQESLIIDFLLEGNSKHDLAQQLMERMSYKELCKILDHIDNVQLDIDAGIL